MTKQQLLDELRNRTEFGASYVKMQMKFMKWATKEALIRVEKK